jgi:lysophospholipase L1-like esterase
MRLQIWMGLALGLAALAGMLAAASRYWCMRQSGGDRRTHVLVIGASIAQAWRISDWPARVGEPRFAAESTAEWSFDKTEAVEAVLRRPAVRFRVSRSWLVAFLRPPRRPDIVILKECSSYFPGDLAAFAENVRAWTRRLSVGGTQVVLATVVPVTRSRAGRDPGKQDGILAYNGWVRNYAREELLTVLDLEAAVRGPDSYLKEEFAAEDGSHLNARAYAMLDRALLDTLAAACPRQRGEVAGPHALAGDPR